MARGCLPGTKAASLKVLKSGNTSVAFDICPIRWIREEASQESSIVQDVFRFKNSGILPFGGGMLDQDWLFVSALDIVDNEIGNIKPSEDK